MNIKQTFKTIKEQYKKYPNLKIEDMIKMIYQSEFGPGHYIKDTDSCLNMIEEETEICKKEKASELVEFIGDGFGRVHLGMLEKCNLNIKTIFKLFMLSAEKAHGSVAGLRKKLKCFEMMCGLKMIPFQKKEVRSRLIRYKHSGYHALHHTREFKQEYAPAYRVINRELCDIIPLLCQIDSLLLDKNQIIVAIDGNCGAGKTTLTKILSKIYDCNVFHMDSFFLQQHQRTESRLSEIGGNIDFERIQSDVLEPIVAGCTFSYKAYKCSTQKMSDPVHVMPKKLNIVEGVYSMHTALADKYDFSVFLSVDSRLQKVRIKKRNGKKMYTRFKKEWIPMENKYFEGMNVKERCDSVFRAKHNSLVSNTKEMV